MKPKKYIVSIPLVGMAHFEVEAWEQYSDTSSDDLDVEWELVEQVATGNVLHAPLNEIEINEVKP
jgi:hypothetical protein